MKRFIPFLTLLICIVSSCAMKNEPLNIATFNIRYGTPKDTADRNWDARKHACVSCITDHGFDVVGIQEALAAQQEDLRNMLPDYAFGFVGRDDGINGEAVGIGYRKDRFELIESGHFWLSPTPDTPSNAQEWGGPTRHRVAKWMKLKDLKTGKAFIYMTTHLEVGGQNANVRAESANLIVNREKEINPDGLPFFLSGDLNPANQEEAMLIRFRSIYDDSYHKAEAIGKRYGPTGTYNGFRQDADMEKAGKGDYIFCKGDYELLDYTTVTTKYDGRYPSDHLAVMINVIL